MEGQAPMSIEERLPAKVRAVVRSPLFSHAEALAIAGLSAEALLTWHRRGFAPETPGREARKGNRRAYSTLDVIGLALAKRLADAGCALSQAQALAGRLLLGAAKRTLGREARPGAEYLMLYPPAAWELVPASALAQQIVERRLEQVTVIDFGAFAGQVGTRYRDVFDLKLRIAAQRAQARRTEELEQRRNRILKVQKMLAGEAFPTAGDGPLSRPGPSGRPARPR